MNRILDLIYGYVEILVQGENPERFLNLCKNRNIYMEKIRYTDDDQLTAQIRATDFRRLGPIRRKTGVYIRIIQKQGMPFFFFRNRKRKAFFAGLLLAGVLIFVMTGRIWNIHIEGNVRNSTETILDFLKEQGVSHGMSKKKVDCSEIAASVRRKFSQVTWVSARIEGTRLLLEIREGISRKNIKEDTAACDLTADKAGVITEMVVRSGVPVKKPGDICKKGDLLVSGELHIMNDSQEIVRKEYVHADADIYISRKISYYQEFPMKYQAEESVGKVRKGVYLRFGCFYLGLYRTAGQNQWCMMEEYPLSITENFVLPVWFGKTKMREYRKTEKLYTEKEAVREAGRIFRIYEKKLLESGTKITENHVRTDITGQSCVTKGTLQIVQKVGKNRVILTENE